MDKIVSAEMSGGGTLDYIIPDGPPHWSGNGTRYAYSKDGTRLVMFLEGSSAEGQLARAEAMARQHSRMEEACILWPCGVIRKPRCGIVWPVVADTFLFGEHSSPDAQLSAMRKGRLRKARWFMTKAARDTLSPGELGDLPRCLAAMEDLAFAVDVLHRNGLACGGLSGNTVLVNLEEGKALLTGAENFWKPGHPMPDGDGEASAPPTPPGSAAAEKEGAPSLVAMQDTDRYALAEIFSGLLGRSFQAAEKARSGTEAEKGSGAAPSGTAARWGGELEGLFSQALEGGLHCPRERPTARHWRSAIARARGQIEKTEAEGGGQTVPTDRKGADLRGGIIQIADAEVLPVVLLSKKMDARHLQETRIEINWDARFLSKFDMDVSAFLMDGRYRVKNIGDLIFYGSPEHVSRSVWLDETPFADADSSPKKRILVNEELIPPETMFIDFVVTVYYEENEHEVLFSRARNAFVSVFNSAGERAIHMNLSRDFPNCSWCLAASLVRENGILRLKQRRKGGRGGLLDVCKLYGVSVQSSS